MFYTDDPIADYERYDAERERKLLKYPVCCNCGEHIQDDYYYLINGKYYCEKCLKSDFRRDIEDFIDLRE